MTKPGWEARRWNPWESEESKEENVVGAGHEVVEIFHAMETLIRGKAKSTTVATPARGAVPTLVQEVFMTREYTPTELIDMVVKFKQKARESTQAWLVWLWDVGDHSISLTGQEAQEMSNTLSSGSTCMANQEVQGSPL